MTSFARSSIGQAFSLLKKLGRILLHGIRVFFWTSFKEGLVDLRPLSRVLRLLTMFGLLVVLVFLGGILFGDVIRAQGAVEALLYESGADRGLMVPSVAIPLTLIGLMLAWSYVLSGALHLRPALRWCIFAAFLLYGFVSYLVGALSVPASFAQISIGVLGGIYVGVLLLLLGAFIVLPRRRLPTALEFSLMLGLNAAMVVVNLIQAVALQVNTGQPQAANQMTVMLDMGYILITPSLIMMGVEMANFGLDVTTWATRSVRKHVAEGLLALLLIAFLGFRLYGLVQRLIGAGVSVQQLQSWGGAALLGLGILFVLLWRRRQARAGTVPLGLVTALILAVTLFQILAAVPGSLISLFFQLKLSLVDLAKVDFDGWLTQFNRSMVLVTQMSNYYRRYYYLVIAGAGLLVAWIAARRRNPSAAAFGIVLAWSRGLAWLMEPGRPLEMLHYEYADVDDLLLLVLIGSAIFWIVRRWRDFTVSTLQSGERVGVSSPLLHILALALLGSVLTQSSFLDNPFSPLFGFAGIFFVVFGVLWNVLTAGGRFANADTVAFPRASRLLLYIGYVLLSVTTLHWYIVSHNVAMQTLQGEMSMSGLHIFGLPLAYLVFAEGGASLVGKLGIVPLPKSNDNCSGQ